MFLKPIFKKMFLFSVLNTPGNRDMMQLLARVLLCSCKNAMVFQVCHGHRCRRCSDAPVRPAKLASDAAKIEMHLHFISCEILIWMFRGGGRVKGQVQYCNPFINAFWRAFWDSILTARKHSETFGFGSSRRVSEVTEKLIYKSAEKASWSTGDSAALCFTWNLLIF